VSARDPRVMVGVLTAKLLGKGVLTLDEVQEILGELSPTDVELLELRPAGMSMQEALERIAHAHGKEQP
jgi:hypothetical protein